MSPHLCHLRLPSSRTIKNTGRKELDDEYLTNIFDRIAHAVSSRKRVEIIEKAKALGVKVTNPKGRVTTEA